MDIYVKPSKKKSLYGKEWVCVGDVCEVFAAKNDESADIIRRVEQLKLINTGGKAGKKHTYLVSALDIVKVIDASFSGSTVVNVGETDTLVEFAPVKVNPNPVFKWLKIAAVAAILFVGSSTAVMAFQTDSELPKVFTRYNEILLGVSTENPYWISIPFSVGLAVGAVVFFNHFAGRKLTNDPTPIEVQMKLYDDDITTTKIEALGNE